MAAAGLAEIEPERVAVQRGPRGIEPDVAGVGTLVEMCRTRLDADQGGGITPHRAESRIPAQPIDPPSPSNHPIHAARERLTIQQRVERRSRREVASHGGEGEADGRGSGAELL